MESVDSWHKSFLGYSLQSWQARHTKRETNYAAHNL